MDGCDRRNRPCEFDGRDNDGDGQVDEGGEFAPRTPLRNVGLASNNMATAIAAGGKQFNIDNPSLLYVGLASGEMLVRTSNQGLPTPTTGSLANLIAQSGGSLAVRDIAVDPRDWAKAYAVSARGVFGTRNVGTQWTSLTGNLFNSQAVGQILGLELISGHGVTKDALVVSTEKGVFMTSLESSGSDFDLGLARSWTRVGNNLPGSYFEDVSYNSAADVLAVSTAGQGAWIIDRASAKLELAIQSQTGDLLEASFSDSFSNATQFQWQSASLVQGNTLIPLSIQPIGDTGNLELRLGSEVYATILPSERYSSQSFASTGSFAFAPSLESNLSQDGSGTDPGWQGQIKLNFFADGQSGSMSIHVRSGMSVQSFQQSSNVLSTAKLQQRLRYLGYTGQGGVSLRVDGIRNGDLDFAIRQFKAAATTPLVTRPFKV